MDKETIGGSKNPKPKVLGANPLQIGQGDVSWLVGGIVEKGVSQNTPLIPPSAPRPSLLPFPVARHRSHGPHWAPKVGKSNIVNDNDDDMDVGEEEDFDGVGLAAAAVKPVQRKERKGLDFSRWKEMVKNDANTESYMENKESNSTRLKVGPKGNEITSNSLSRKFSNPDDNVVASEMASTKEFHSFRHVNNENIVQTKQNNNTKSEESIFVEEVSTWQSGLSKEVDLKAHNMQKSYMSSSFTEKKFVGREEDSLQSEIDAENSAQLAKMSVDEIAEAQAEITARLNPELINALKKRAQAKVKRQKFSLSDVAVNTSDSMEQDRVMFKSSETTIHDETVKPLSGDTLKDKDDKISPGVNTNKGRMWDAWRKRVEHARDVRFSLDGDIIGSDLAHVSDTGSTSLESGYNPNNVSTRDYLRTDGDPSAAGYTIKEAVALTRSVVPGQRTFALHVIAVILNRAICSICHSQVDSATNSAGTEGPVDWEAIWAFALGPEPELALTLRMSLDDNHDIVVLACAKAIQCVISCDMNENLFDILEKTPTYVKDVCTAPVFRSKPDVNVGFLRGGFWKYNTKPSNILQFGGELEGDKTEGEHTIQDDVVVAGQDFAAGLVRMGILPRICHLLETDPSAPLEECLISILIAIARHSPTCAAAVADFEGLVQTVASRFATKEQLEINSCKIKSVTLLKVLSRLNRKSCLAFINNGILRQVTWHLYRYPFSLDQWVKSGRKACKLSSALLVEQLRLWKVSIQYGSSISDFSDLFTALCAWLSVPTIEKLIENDVMNEYCAITKEAYLLLDVLASRLPNFYSPMHERTEDAAQDEEAWSWTHFGSIIDLAVEWIDVKNIPLVSRLINCQHNDGENRKLQDSEVNSVLWVISSVLNMLSSLLKAVIPEDIMSLPNGRLPWLPDFVPKIGLQIIKNGYFKFSGPSDTISNGHTSENGSLVQYLCHLRLKERQELAISAQCCLQGLVQAVDSVDKLIQHANLDIHTAPAKFQNLSWDDKVLANGILKSCKIEIRFLLSTLMKLIINDWQRTQSIEIFGRGGPAPGVGVGWGASGGGYWSVNSLLAEQDARLLTNLLEISEIPSSQDPFEAEEMSFAMQKLNCALTSSLIVGPGNRSVLDKLLKAIFQVPVLKYLDFGIRQFLCLKKGHNLFKWNYEEEEYSLFANVLATHFRNRWLAGKKRKATGEISHVSSKSAKKNVHSLETIHEDMDTANMASEESSSLRSEWAYQRLPLPLHWFLSAITTIQCGKISCPPGASKKATYIEVPSDFVEIAKGGLFFLLGIEAISTSLSSEFCSPVKHVPVVWKLHAMSVVLLTGMDVLEDAKSRDVYETLQNVYAEILDEKKFPDVHHKTNLEFLKFESDIHENYSTFIEMLVEQFAAESYGDMLFGRQVAIYLHRSVEASIRLAAWNALSNARALELLPPLHKCFAKAEGYLEPIEDEERILEAYAKSWVSGVLDKAANRSSVSFSLVLHHLSSFIFGNITADTHSLRKKLAKSLLRDFSRKQQREGMMVKLILYEPQGAAETAAPPAVAIEKRLQVLKEICDGHANELQKLQSCCISSTR
ncbi:hypothetical protein ACS0TY_004079 [Phlomoides rotata]